MVNLLKELICILIKSFNNNKIEAGVINEDKREIRVTRF